MPTLRGVELPEDDDVLGHLVVLEPASVVEDGLETPTGQITKDEPNSECNRVSFLAWICQPKSSGCTADYCEEHHMRERERLFDNNEYQDVIP